MKLLALIVSPFIFLSCAHTQPCTQTRGALDVGSGATKALVAVVDTCEKQIRKVVYQQDVPIAFAATLEKQADKRFPQTLVNEAKIKISGLVTRMRAQGASQIAAVATAAFRKVANGAAVASDIGSSVGVKINVVTQDQEAALGFAAALAAKNATPRDGATFVVWDIGGGSAQITSQLSSQLLSQGVADNGIYKSDLASVTFKNRVIAELQKADPKRQSSPNPLFKYRDQAVALAQNHASRTLPADLKERAKSHRWIGIGGVLARSVQDQVAKGQDHFTIAQLEAALQTRAALSDKELEGEYRETDVTNLALVLGYMKALGLEKVETAKVSLTQGLLVSQ